MSRAKISDPFEDDYGWFVTEKKQVAGVSDFNVHGPFASKEEAEIKRMELRGTNVNRRATRKPK